MQKLVKPNLLGSAGGVYIFCCILARSVACFWFSGACFWFSVAIPLQGFPGPGTHFLVLSSFGSAGTCCFWCFSDFLGFWLCFLFFQVVLVVVPL